MRQFQALLGLCLTHGLMTLVATMTISPHGGYLSIDEGTDFYLECLGIEPKWILAQRMTMDAGRLSTQVVQTNRKSILSIQSMDASLIGPYLCQTNQSVSTIIIQLIKRHREMAKQIRFMGTTTNQSVRRASDVRLNCYAQYYSEKAMDSPYLPKILWYFERHQIFHREDKYLLGADSLIIRNFTYYDQGVYYCRAFITLRNDLLTKIYPVLIQLQDRLSSPGNETAPSSVDTATCANFTDMVLSNNTITYCNLDGQISNQTCPTDETWNEDYLQCSLPPTDNAIVQIIPSLSSIDVELGRTYTLLCRTLDPDFKPEWSHENGTRIPIGRFPPTAEITSYMLEDIQTVYLRLAPVRTGTYVCRSRPVTMLGNNSHGKQDTARTTMSITLTGQMITRTNGLLFQSSTLAEYHLHTNETLFLACRPEYFDFQLEQRASFVPKARLIHVNDNAHLVFSDVIDGLLIGRLEKTESGMYLCMGTVPLAERLISALYPVMVFVSDPLCE